MGSAETKEPIDKTAIATAVESLTDGKVAFAVASLWLYLVASQFLAGFLAAFGCEASWFNPSFFQVVSFSGFAILLAILLAAVYDALLTPDFARKFWWLIFAIWVIGIGLVSYEQFELSRSEVIASRLSLKITLYSNNVFLIVLPLASRIAWAIIDRHPIEPSAELHAIEQELSRVEEMEVSDEKYEAVQALKARLRKYTDEHNTLPDLTFFRRHRSVIGACVAAYQVLVLAQILGLIYGGIQGNRDIWATSTQATLQSNMRILFTDGVRSVCAVRNENKTVFVFTNPQGNQVITTYPLHSYQTATTSPATSASPN